jgi:DNA-binding FrmR family transcriptional regulator
MIGADGWCPNVAIQVASATRTLREVAVGLLSDHVGPCVLPATYGSEQARLATTIR